MGKILRVDLKEKKLWDESIDEEFARKYIGGVGIATKLLYDEVPKGADPLGPENKLIFMTGPLTGTTSPSASRYSVVARSPLTRLWGHANSGGSFGPMLKRSGYDGIIFECISPEPVYLTIDDGKPHEKGAIWSDSYLISPAVQAAFDSFWANRPAPDGVGIQDHYAAMWAHVAARFADNETVIA